ncbi:MAG TPA: hypothetical protein LFV91_07575 [Rickettsia endosymbiont of Bembidion nr. Transversale]|nr:hypothetical protein [Rickettsia endosymbiont of Bembidion nr. Transversale]
MKINNKKCNIKEIYQKYLCLLKKLFLVISKRVKTSIFVLLLIMLLFNYKTVSNYMMSYSFRHLDRQSAQLSRLINSVMGVPFKLRPQYKNDAPSIHRLSYEEWMNLPYEEKHLTLEIDMMDDPNHLVDHMPTIHEVEQADSYKVHSPYSSIGVNRDIAKRLCNHFLTCELLTLSVRSYVLDNPEILKNIIKIAERPCDYIQDLDKVNLDGEFVWERKYAFAGGHIFFPDKYTAQDTKDLINHARKCLDCDRKGTFKLPTWYGPSIYIKKYILLVINESGINVDIKGHKLKDSIDILIRRKDLD